MYFTYYSHSVVNLFSMGLCNPASSFYSFEKLGYRLFVFPVFLFQFDVTSKDFKYLITYSFLCSHYMTNILVKYKNCDIKMMPPLEVLSFLKKFYFKFHFTNKFYL